MVSTEKLKSGNELKIDEELVQLMHMDGNNSMEQILCKIDGLQSQVSGLKARLGKVMRENPAKFTCADNPGLDVPSNALTKSRNLTALSTGNEDRMIEGSPIATQLLAEYSKDGEMIERSHIPIATQLLAEYSKDSVIPCKDGVTASTDQSLVVGTRVNVRPLSITYSVITCFSAHVLAWWFVSINCKLSWPELFPFHSLLPFKITLLLLKTKVLILLLLNTGSGNLNTFAFLLFSLVRFSFFVYLNYLHLIGQITSFGCELDYFVIGTLHKQFIEKDINTFEDFHLAILDIFKYVRFLIFFSCYFLYEGNSPGLRSESVSWVNPTGKGLKVNQTRLSISITSRLKLKSLISHSYWESNLEFCNY